MPKGLRDIISTDITKSFKELCQKVMSQNAFLIDKFVKNKEHVQEYFEQKIAKVADEMQKSEIAYEDLHRKYVDNKEKLHEF